MSLTNLAAFAYKKGFSQPIDVFPTFFLAVLAKDIMAAET